MEQSDYIDYASPSQGFKTTIDGVLYIAPCAFIVNPSSCKSPMKITGLKRQEDSLGRINDVVLKIGGTKFFVPRLYPMHVSEEERLQHQIDYLQKRRQSIVEKNQTRSGETNP